MSVTGSGPVLPFAGAPARGHDDRGPGVTTVRAPRLRTTLSLARVEAWLLVRSLLVLGGLLAGGVVTWLFIDRFEPL